MMVHAAAILLALAVAADGAHLKGRNSDKVLDGKSAVHTVDTAIVGAGTAGTYAGWRMLSAGYKKGSEVEIFERQSHVGGT